MPRLTTMYAGASGSHRGNNFMSGGMCNNKWQGLPATRNMRTGPLLTHVRTQAYAPPADRNRIFNALGGAAYTGKIYPHLIYSMVFGGGIFAGRERVDGVLSSSLIPGYGPGTRLLTHNLESTTKYVNGCLDWADAGEFTHYSYLDEFAIYDKLIAKGYTIQTTAGDDLSRGVEVSKTGSAGFNLPYAYAYTFVDGNKGGKLFFLFNLAGVDESERIVLIDLLELISGTGGKCN